MRISDWSSDVCSSDLMRSFAYLDDTDDGLSIRDWVATEGDDSWLFVTVKADQLPSLRPLITVWLDIAISAIMSLKPDQQRRLYCVIDELPSLQKLPSLSDFLARPRKYGGRSEERRVGKDCVRTC